MKLAVLVRSIAAVASFAFLSAVTIAATITQTFNMPVNPTDITGMTGVGTFNYFQSASPPPLSVLNSVTLRITVVESLQSLTVTNNDLSNPQTFSYVSYSNVTPTGTAPAPDQTALNLALATNGGVNGDVDLIDTTSLLYTPGETKTFAPPVLSGFGGNSGVVISATPLAYDTTGSFTLGFTTTTFQSFVGGGGNGSNAQVTDATATVEVIYDYTVVPEPHTITLVGFGLLGLAGVCLKKKR
jgi:hypothetical protein